MKGHQGEGGGGGGGLKAKILEAMYETKLDFPREWGRGAKQRYFLELHNTRICKSLPFRERGEGGWGK